MFFFLLSRSASSSSILRVKLVGDTVAGFMELSIVSEIGAEEELRSFESISDTAL